MMKTLVYRFSYYRNYGLCFLVAICSCNWYFWPFLRLGGLFLLGRCLTLLLLFLRVTEMVKQSV